MDELKRTLEQDRINALKEYYILDTLREDEFDKFTELASIICETPISLVSLIDNRRQWFKSKIGLDLPETAKELAFCQYAILEKKSFQVTDATEDVRFKNNDLVTGYPHIRFYASYPLIDPAGYALGTLCVIDRVPRQLTPMQEKALQLMAEEVMSLIVKRREREELLNFQKLFNVSNDLLCIAGYDGYFKRINPAFGVLLGYDEQYLLGTPFIHLIHPDDVAATENESGKLLEGQVSFNFINRYRTKSGSYKTIQWITAPEPNKPNLFAIGRDITTEQIREKQLEESENRFRSFFNGSQGYMYTHDLDGKFLSVNNVMSAAIGGEAEQMQQLTLYDIVPKNNHAKLQRYLIYIQLRSKASGMFTVLNHEGKESIWAYSNIIATGGDGKDYVIGNSVDITERLIIEKELERTREILEQTNKVAQVGGWELHVEEKTIYWTSVTRQIHEVEADFIPDLQTGILFYKEGEDRENITNAVNKAISEGVSFDLELRIITAKGRTLWVRAKGQPKMHNGKCVRLMGTFQDINEQKQEALTLQKSTAMIKQQNDRLLNFAHIVSHNLRSHTGNLHMMLDIIDEEPNTANKLEHLIHLRTVSQTLNETIDSLNEVVQVQTNIFLEKSTVSFKKKFNNAINALSGIIQKEQALITDNFDALPEIEHIPAYIESIMLNFISNSLKYKHPERNPVIMVSSDNTDGVRSLTFSDNGIGIDLDKYGDKIFGLYKTFHRHPDARGIGLFMSKSQIESLGGTIRVESSPGIGTSFTILF